MTDQAPWLRYIERNPVHIVAEFTNEQGERFIIYRNEHGDKPYITGDEFGWEPKVGLLWGDFTYSQDERDQIAKILFPTFADYMNASLDDMAIRPSSREWVAGITAAHPGIDTTIPLTEAVKAWEYGRSPDEVTTARDAVSALTEKIETRQTDG